MKRRLKSPISDNVPFIEGKVCKIIVLPSTLKLSKVGTNVMIEMLRRAGSFDKHTKGDKYSDERRTLEPVDRAVWDLRG